MNVAKNNVINVAVHQMCSGINIFDNIAAMKGAIIEASSNDAHFYFAPEMSVLLDRNRSRAASSIFEESDTSIFQSLQDAAAEAGIWVHLGSAPVRTNGDMLANRTLIIDDNGQIIARYDKIHLFDVDLSTGESWKESAAYAAGQRLALADTPLGKMGLSICYDLRFPALFSQLARNGANIFAVPAAFTKPTGAAHWHILLRARAIENACFVVAAAQSGVHADGRETFGHSLVVDPWGEVLLDMGEGEGIGYAEIDLRRIDEVRSQIPVHKNWREIPAL